MKADTRKLMITVTSGLEAPSQSHCDRDGDKLKASRGNHTVAGIKLLHVAARARSITMMVVTMMTRLLAQALSRVPAWACMESCG